MRYGSILTDCLWLQQRLAEMQSELKRTKRHEAAVLQCRIAYWEGLRWRCWTRWVRRVAAWRTTAQERWWRATEPQARGAVVGTMPAERLRIVLIKLQLAGTKRAQRGGGTSGAGSWQQGLCAAVASVCKAQPSSGMTSGEFIILVRRVARIAPGLVTDEEISSIFLLAQGEMAVKGGLWTAHLRQRERMLPSEREREEAGAGVVSGLELSQLLEDLLGYGPVGDDDQAQEGSVAADAPEEASATAARGRRAVVSPRAVSPSGSLARRRETRASSPLHNTAATQESAGQKALGSAYSPSLGVDATCVLSGGRSTGDDGGYRYAASPLRSGSHLHLHAAGAPAAGKQATEVRLDLRVDPQAVGDLFAEMVAMDLPHDVTPPTSPRDPAEEDGEGYECDRSALDLQPIALARSPISGGISAIGLPRDVMPPSPSRQPSPGSSHRDYIDMDSGGEDELSRLLREASSWLDSSAAVEQ